MILLNCIEKGTMLSQQLFLCMIAGFLSAEKSDDKRLVLHSGDDIATEFLTLRQEMQALRTSLDADIQAIKVNCSMEIQSVKSKHILEMQALRTSHDADIQALKANYSIEIQKLETKHSLEMQTFRSEIETLQRDQGSTYVRWGRKSCYGNETEMVYSGFTSGSPYNIEGGAARPICLPEHPTWAKYIDGIQDLGGYVSGTEYDLYSNIFNPFPQNMHDQDAPCAVCRSPRQTTITIPGRTSCFPGWTMEYNGYLMTGHTAHHAANDYACVDADPEAVYHGEANQNGKLFNFAEVKCGSLPCQEYPEGRELACVVCSK